MTLLFADQLAKRLGVQRTAVVNWNRRHQRGFPLPFDRISRGTGQSAPRWDWELVRQWAIDTDRYDAVTEAPTPLHFYRPCEKAA